MVDVGGNTIGNKLTAKDNSATGGSLVNEAFVGSNIVGDNLEIAKNTVSGPGAMLDVSSNSVTKKLDCKDNAPPPIGAGNTAASKNGQCAGL